MSKDPNNIIKMIQKAVNHIQVTYRSLLDLKLTNQAKFDVPLQIGFLDHFYDVFLDILTFITGQIYGNS